MNYDVLQVFGTSPFEAQVGLRGTPNTDFYAREGTNGWQQTTVANSNLDFVELSSTSYPPQGLRYVWQNLTALIPDHSTSFSVQSFPNPASNSVNFVFPTVREELVVDILGIDGRSQAQHILPAGITNCTIDVSSLQPGSYILGNGAKNSW